MINEDADGDDDDNYDDDDLVVILGLVRMRMEEITRGFWRPWLL